MNFIPGGVCSAKGFYAGGLCAGLKNGKKPDLALIVSEKEAAAAAVYTKNIVKAAPLDVTKKHLSDGKLKAVVVNSGNANACAPDGMENAEIMCSITANALGISEDSVAVASTGVIGQSLTEKMTLMESGIEKLAGEIYAVNAQRSGSGNAARAIMTTDTVEKEWAVEFELGGKRAHLGAIAKGSGMIHPNMGTMLCFITTDVSISAKLLQKALVAAVKKSFNRVSIDGDTSTNDMCLVMANGMAENAEITEESTDYAVFLDAITEVCMYLARAMAADGEGAGRLVTCLVKNAVSEETGEILGKAVISSSLFKAAMFGADANWGRALCAMGYSGAEFEPEKVSMSFESGSGSVEVCSAGRGLKFDEELAKKILSEKEVTVVIDLAAGAAECTCWGCDLTYEYVRINGDYRS